MPRLNSPTWTQLLAAYAFNALCAWMVFFEEDCTNSGQNFCDAVRPLHLLWLPLLIGLAMLVPAGVPLALAAHFKMRFTSAIYFIGALTWTLLCLDLYARGQFAPDGHGCESCLLIVVQYAFNWLWVPIGFIAFVIELSLHERLQRKSIEPTST
jgi:hypothetical protein